MSDISPFPQLGAWLEDAKKTDKTDVLVVCVSTCSKDLKPSSRMLVLAGYGEDGIKFFADSDSRKAKELAENPFASAVLYFRALSQQIRMEGKVESLPQSRVEAYFKSLPRDKQITSLMDTRGQQFPSFEHVLKARKDTEEKYKDVTELPVPQNMAGYLLVPTLLEFHQGRPDWLSDCTRYEKQLDGSWCKKIVSQ